MLDSMMKLVYKYKLYIKYVISGGTAAFVDLSLLFVFTSLVGWHYLLSASLAFIIAFFVSFYLQKFWTFRDNNRDEIYKQLFLYMSVGLINLALNAGIMFVLVAKLNIWYLSAQVITGALIALESFIFYNLIIFNKGEKIISQNESK